MEEFEFETALKNIVHELETDYNFFFEEYGEQELMSVITKHLSPFIDFEELKKNQILMLRAKLDALEGI